MKYVYLLTTTLLAPRLLATAFLVVPPRFQHTRCSSSTSRLRLKPLLEDTNRDSSSSPVVQKKDGFLQIARKKLIEISVATLLATMIPWGIDLNLQPLQLPAVEQQPAKIISLQKSQAWALSEEQMLINEVWREVTRQFVDQTFAGQGEEGWRQKRLEAVKKAVGLTPDDRQEVYKIIRTMLDSLKDPYTRFLTPEQYESLTTYATGRTTTGIGVQLLGDPATGDIVVVNTIPDGPAQKAGVLPGDVVLEVDGMEMKGATAEVAAARCRGSPGSQVNLALRHGGVDASGKAKTPVSRITVTRAAIANNPVQVSTFTASNGRQFGLIKLTSFSQETVKNLADALSQIRSKVFAIVIDLRGNAGGFMPAGVDGAKLFLPPNSRIISEIDKTGRATIFFNEGVGSETDLPLYVLVDKRTASASEIMAAALQDNGRATIVGSSRTFGKGRIQNVQELSDGGVAVTKAKYMTSAGRDIQGIGIAPDRVSKTCEPADSAAACLAGAGIL